MASPLSTEISTPVEKTPLPSCRRYAPSGGGEDPVRRSYRRAVHTGPHPGAGCSEAGTGAHANERSQAAARAFAERRRWPIGSGGPRRRWRSPCLPRPFDRVVSRSVDSQTVRPTHRYRYRPRYDPASAVSCAPDLGMALR